MELVKKLAIFRSSISVTKKNYQNTFNVKNKIKLPKDPPI